MVKEEGTIVQYYLGIKCTSLSNGIQNHILEVYSIAYRKCKDNSILEIF